MMIPRTDQELTALRNTLPGGVVDFLGEVSEEDRADVFSTVAILEGPADLTTPIIVTDGSLTVDFGTPLCDAAGAPRVLATIWEVVAEPAPGWAFLYEVVSDAGGCAVVLEYVAPWVPQDLRGEIVSALDAAE